MSALRRLFAMTRIETLQLLRDRPSLSLILLVPVLQLALFGYAVRLEPGPVPVALAGPADARTADAEQALRRDPGLVLISPALSAGGAEAAVRDGRALAGVELPEVPPPAAYAPTPPVRVVVDGTQPAGAAQATAALQAQALRAAGAPPTEVVRLFNPDRRSDWVLAPGLIGVVVMISSLMLGAQALVREREEGSWETLLATPLTAGEVLAGKLLPQLAVAFVQAVTVLAAARLLFGLPLRGAWATLILATPLLGAAHLMLGLAISAAARTRLQAVQGAVFVYLPSLLLSGFVFPLGGMPAWARALAEALPLTHWVRAARGVLLRGADAGLVLREMGPVALFAAGGTALALLAYRRRLA